MTDSAKETPGSDDVTQGDQIDSPFMSMLLTEAPTEDPPLYRVSVDEFQRMAEFGVFPPEARVELVNGVLVEMSPLGPGHNNVIVRLNRLLVAQLVDRAVISVQGPLEGGEVSQLQPDVAVLQWPDDRYDTRCPRPDDALLVVEVADSSLRYDQKVKVPLYGRLGVPETWVVDLPRRRVHVYADPKHDGYGTTTTRMARDVLVPTAFPDVEIAVRDLGLDRLG